MKQHYFPLQPPGFVPCALILRARYVLEAQRESALPSSLVLDPVDRKAKARRLNRTALEIAFFLFCATRVASADPTQLEFLCLTRRTETAPPSLHSVPRLWDKEEGKRAEGGSLVFGWAYADVRNLELLNAWDLEWPVPAGVRTMCLGVL